MLHKARLSCRLQGNDRLESNVRTGILYGREHIVVYVVVLGSSLVLILKEAYEVDNLMSEP